MEEKSAWDKFFDDTEDIQCISCLDACVLEYFIDDCRVQVDRISPGKYSIEIRGYDDKKDLCTNDFSKAWKKKNIYDQAIYKKFVSGYFFHENEKVEIDFTQEELHLLYAACISYKKSISKEGKRTNDVWNLARKITDYMEDRINLKGENL
ncbi:MAG: hypothetical protein HDQ97_12160 [Lachnospiraceae bacterium]|nr:hypothetical protein [Lachnospiraceae bacterium]